MGTSRTKQVWIGAALVACLLVGCLEPEFVTCGDLLCPAQNICVANALCASADQVAACAGAVDNSECAVAGANGACDRGVCITGRCGNGIVDLGEPCDDGNRVSGDGCRADCRKREVCGDAVVDEGEGCDDGNTTGGDGCPADCLRLESCGDALVDVGESCDDGNTVSGDGCRSDCRKLELCGDTVVDDGEGCDDGNLNAADGCDGCIATTWRATSKIGGSTQATAVGIVPYGVAVDRNGAVYIADQPNHRVRRVDANGVITTVAGTGAPGSSGDGGPAPSAQLSGPVAIAVDGLGHVYIATANRIRRVDAYGVITTVAGTGDPGFSGDGGPATSARLSNPGGIAVDGLGALYISDTNNYRLRKVDANGIITTLAGTGTSGYSGDNGAANAAMISYTEGVAVDHAGNVYLADGSNRRIRRIDTSGIITTVAGTGVSGFSGDGGAATAAMLGTPQGIAVDELGVLYIADGPGRIRRVDTGGVITTIAGTGTTGFSGDGGPATSAQIATPKSVAVDPQGTVYIADASNERIRRITAAGVISTCAGNGNTSFSGDGGAATSASLGYPRGVTVDVQGRVYISDAYARLRRVGTDGTITTIAGTGTYGFSGDGGPAASAQIVPPRGLALDGAGAVLLATGSRVRKVDPSGIITTIAGTGTSGFSGDGGPATSAQLDLPHGIAIDGGGAIYIADEGAHRVRRIDTSGVITTYAGTGTAGFSGDDGPAASAELSGPRGVAVDGLGALYVADAGNNRIRRISPTGVITTYAGTGNFGFSGDGAAAVDAELSFPTSVSLGASGAVQIADSGNNRIREVDANGMITTIAGTGDAVLAGDGGPALDASINSPVSIARDTAGALYIAEEAFDDRVRKIDAGGVIRTIAGSIDPEGMGPLAQARLTDPRALVLAAPFTLVAGGTTGTVQAARVAPPYLEVVAGRYPQPAPIGALARFRDRSFGTISGIAYDAASGRIYLTETPANRLHVVTVVDPADEHTWTIAPLANEAGDAGFADGAALTARFRAPTGLYFDAVARQLYVADTGNHVVRAIDLASGLASATVRTVAGIPATRGMFGDGGPATAALLYAPQAITRCASGDLFVADTSNHRVRRIAAGSSTISTVVGVGVGASSGEGFPAASYPVHAPLGLACDAYGNLFVTSTTTVRMLPADASGIVDGTGGVQTIYGALRDAFPASVTTCLTGLAVVDATAIQVVDACAGLLVELTREAE